MMKKNVNKRVFSTNNTLTMVYTLKAAFWKTGGRGFTYAVLAGYSLVSGLVETVSGTDPSWSLIWY